MAQGKSLSYSRLQQSTVGVLITLFLSLLLSGCLEQLAADPAPQNKDEVLSNGVTAYEPNQVKDKYDIPFNKVTRVTAHNAFLDPMENQLKRGVRGFMLDVHYTGNVPYNKLPLRLCHISIVHTSCNSGDKIFVDEMNNTFIPFLKANPNEVITIHLESGVVREDLRLSFQQIPGIDELVFNPEKFNIKNGWPTLREIIDSGQRIVLIVDSDSHKGKYVINKDTPQEGIVYAFRDKEIETQNFYDLGANALNHNWSCATRWEPWDTEYKPFRPCTTKGEPEGCPIAAIPCQVEGVPKGCPHLGVPCEVEGIPKGCPIAEVACTVHPLPLGCPLPEVPSRPVAGIPIDPEKAGYFASTMRRLFVMNQFHAFVKSEADAGNVDNNLTYLERRVEDHCKAAAEGVRVVPSEIAIDYTNVGDAQSYADALTYGGVYFYEKKHADRTGDTTCVLPAGQDYKLTLPSHGCENDEIQSLLLRGISKGTRIVLHDSKTSDEDDYLKILVKKDIDLVNGVVVPSVEESISNEFIEARYVRNDGMGGGVSRITIEETPTEFGDSSVSLMEGDNGGQNITCTIPMTAALTRDMKGECDNDETRSAIISVAKAGTVMTLYGDWGSSNCNQGCVEVVAKRNLFHKIIGSYEDSYEDEDVKVTRSGGTQQLAGKVSSIRIAFQPDVIPPSTPVPAPNALQVSATSATITWAKALDNVGVKDYLLSINGGSQITETGTERVLTNLAPGTDYTVSIKARDAAGNVSPTAAFIRFATVPATPQNLSLRNLNGHVTLTWKLDNLKTRYEVFANGKKVFDGVGAMAGFFRANVPPGPVYTIIVRAKTGASYSADATLVQTIDETRPEDPGVPLVSNITETSATVTWEASGTPGFNRYIVSNGKWTDITSLNSKTFNQLKPGINQTVSVQTIGANGNFSDAKIVKFKTLGESTEPRPGTPKNLRIEGVVSNSVTLAWDEGDPKAFVHGVTSNYHDDIKVVTVVNKVRMEGLLSNRTYHFKVTAYDVYEQPSEPAEITVQVGDVVPPSSPFISPEPLQLSQTSVKVEWAPAVDDLGVKDYLVSLNGAAPVTVVGTNHVFSNLTYANPYEVEVSARDAAGNVSPASAVNFQIKDKQAPTPPGKPFIETIVGHSATLRWTPATDNVGVVDYKVIINNEASVVVAGTSYLLTGLKDLSSYTVEVIARDAAGNVSTPTVSTFDTKDLTPPTKPGDPIVSNITGTSSTVAWSASIDNVGVAGYTITVNGEAPFSVTGFSHDFSNLQSLTEYTVTIHAVDGAGNVSHPATVVFSTLLKDNAPPVVRTLEAKNIDIYGALIKWTSDDNVGVTGHTLSLDGASPINVAGQSLQLSGLEMGTSHSVVVRAMDAAGNISLPATVAFRTDASPKPAPPGIPVASNISSTLARIDWAPSPEEFPSIVCYRVSLDKGEPVCTAELYHSFTGLKELTTYNVEVQARDERGYESVPTAVQFTTKKAEEAPPLPPTNLREISNQNRNVQIAWDAPSSEVTGYVVTVLGRATPVVGTSHTVNNLTPGFSYVVSVQSKNYAGQLSAVVNITVWPN